MDKDTANTVETTEKAAGTEKHTPKKEKKQGFFRGVKKEYKKIVFADKQTIAKQTTAVITMSIIIGAMIAVLDLVMKFGLSFIL